MKEKRKMKNKKILVIGYGYVGKAMHKTFKDKYDCDLVDPSFEVNQIELDDDGKTLKYNLVADIPKGILYDLAVICVPTPMKETRDCDISIVEESVKKIADLKLAKTVLIKSTVAPGTTDRLCKESGLDVVFSPEYVGEGSYYVTPRMAFQTDMKATPFMILGGRPETCNEIFDLFTPITGPERTYYKTTALNAELIKYMENTYFGVKVTFANEMRNLVEKAGGDWYDVWQGWALDPRVDVMHTAVFPESRGFGGKCLPKDLNALVEFSRGKGYEPEFLKEMLRSNERFNKQNKES